MVDNDVSNLDVGYIECTWSQRSVQWVSQRFVVKGYSTTNDVADVFALVVFLEVFNVVFVYIVKTSLYSLDTTLVGLTGRNDTFSLDTLTNLNSLYSLYTCTVWVVSLSVLYTFSVVNSLLDSLSVLDSANVS